jgi:hypothetical protein
VTTPEPRAGGERPTQAQAPPSAQEPAARNRAETAFQEAAAAPAITRAAPAENELAPETAGEVPMPTGGDAPVPAASASEAPVPTASEAPTSATSETGPTLATDVAAPARVPSDATLPQPDTADLSPPAPAGDGASASDGASPSKRAAEETSTPATVIFVSSGGVRAVRTPLRAYALASLTVTDAGHRPVAGATVSLAWSGLVRHTGTGTTDANGNVSIVSRPVNRPGTMTMTIRRVQKDGCTYEPARNAVRSASATVR